LATARGEDARVTELLGWSHVDVPLADADEVGCGVLRAHVLEKQGRTKEAADEITHVLNAHGKAALRYELAVMASLSPAPGSTRHVLTHHDEHERQQIRNGIEQMKKQLAIVDSSTWNISNLIGALFLGFVVSLVLTVPWSCGVVPGADIDPWLGPHAKTFCPMVCDGCTGPYSYLKFHTSGSGGDSDHFFVYCNDPGGSVMSMHRSWGGLMNNMEANAEYELPGGGFTLWLTSLPCLTPVGFFFWLIYRFATSQKRVARAREVKERIAVAERRLAAVGS
jgi:hypothetical protein